MPTFQIGAGSRVTTGSAATPSTVTVDRTAYFKAFTVNSALATANTTALDADTHSYAESFIAALSTGTVTGQVMWDYPAGDQYIAWDDIRTGSNHAAGRGKVDIEFAPFGTASGSLKLAFTVVPTAIDIGATIGDAVSGSLNFQVDGAVVASQY